LFQSYVNDKNTADKPIKSNGQTISIVEKERQLKRFLNFHKRNPAVLLDLGSGKYHIITKYDIIGSIK
jgi:cystathionine beta-synthase